MNSKKSLCVLVIAASAYATISSVASAQLLWSDNFDSYTLGNVDGQGPWNDFGGLKQTDVSNVQSLSPDQSMRLEQGPADMNPVNPGYGSDVWMNFPGGPFLRNGTYRFTYSQYVESSFDGIAAMFISERALPAATGFNEGAFLIADNNQLGAGSLVYRNGEVALGSAPLVLDAWADYELLIDLDNNLVDITYDGQIVNQDVVWNFDMSGGARGLVGLNFWLDGAAGSNANGTDGAVFYDNFSLERVPEPAGLALIAMAGLGLLGVRRRK